MRRAKASGRDLIEHRTPAGKLGEIVEQMTGSAPLARVKDDLRRFKALTLGKPIVMGRKTYEVVTAQGRHVTAAALASGIPGAFFMSCGLA